MQSGFLGKQWHLELGVNHVCKFTRVDIHYEMPMDTL